MTIKISGDDISDEYNKTNSELNFKVNKFGFELDEKGRIEYFNHKDKDYGSEYDIIVKSTATEDTCNDYKEDKTYTVEVTINTTPGTQNDYYPVQDEKISKINKVWKFSGKITK